jgi:hypothetical protein
LDLIYNKKKGKMKSFKQFNESSNNTDSKFEIIGSNLDGIFDAINFINKNYDIKLKAMDWSLLVSGDLSLFVKFEPTGEEEKHISFINDLLYKNNFNCKLYKTK